MILMGMILFSVFLVKAQDMYLVKGKITSEDKQAVLMANVVAKNSVDSSILSFSFSNEEGIYSIEIPAIAGACLLQVSALGYKEKWITLIQDSLKKQAIVVDLILPYEIINMQAVVIKAAGPAIRVKNDTTEFRAASFSDGTERKIGELLKKLPGVSVAEDGSVFVNGRKVKKILVDGDDIWKGQSDLITKHLPANIVEKVQSIDNYTDNAVMKDFEESGEIALNLSIKEELKFKNNLDLEGAGGPNGRWEIDLHNLAIVKKTKVAAILGMNNTGKMYLLERQDMAASVDANTAVIPVTSAINFEKLPSFQIATKRFNDNFSTLGALSLNHSFTPFFKTQGYFALSRDNARIQQNIQNTYYLTEDTLSNQETFSNRYQPLKWNAQFNTSYTGHENLNFEGNLAFTTTSESIANQLNSSLNGKSTSSFGNLEQYFHQGLKSTIKLSPNQVLFLDAFAYQGTVAQSLGVSRWQGQSMEELKLSDSHQDALINLGKIAFTGKQLIKIHKQLKLKNQIGFFQDREAINTVFKSSEHVQSPDKSGHFDNAVSTHKVDAFVAAGVSLQMKRFKLSGDLKLQHLSLRLTDHLVSTPKSWLNLNPALGFGWALKGVSKVYGTYFKGNTVVAITDLTDGYVMQGYRDFQNAFSNEWLNQVHTLILGYFDFNLYKQSTFSLSLFRNVSDNAYSRFVQITQDYTFLTRMPQGKYKLFSLNVSKDQLVTSLSTKIRLNGSLSISTYPLGLNNQFSSAESRTISSSILAQSALSGPFNADAEFKLGASQIQSDFAHTTNVYTQVILNAKYKFTPWFRGGLHLDMFQKDLSDPQSNELVFMDAFLMATPKNRPYFFELRGTNLTGLKWFETLSIGDAYQYYSSLKLNPRQLILKFGYSF